MGDLKLQIFSDRLKELRLSMNLTQVEFVKDMSFTASALSAYEKNLKNPSISVAIQIAEQYNVSLDWLCGLSDVKSNKNEMETYSDIIKALFTIDMASCGLQLSSSTEEVSEIGFSGYPEIRELHFNNIFFNDYRLNRFLEEWNKMKLLHDNGTIDDDVYKLWIEKTLKKYNEQINQPFEPLETTEED